MKEEILRVLRMQAEGKLTVEQAAELLAALADENQRPRETAEPAGCAGRAEKGDRAGRGPDWGDAFVGIGSSFRRAASEIRAEVRNAFYREEGENVVRMSRFDPPRGEGFSFDDNSVNVSAVSGLVLTRAVMDDNVINASKIATLTITDGKLIDCEISGSSLDNVTLERAELADSKFQGTKCARLRVESAADKPASRIVDVEFQGSALRDVTLRASRWKDSTVQGSSLANITCEEATVEDVTIQGVSFADVRLRQTTWNDVEVQGYRFGDVTFVGCKLDDVVVRCDTANHGRMQGVTFENCAWSDCRLVGCTFEKCAFKDVMLDGVELRGVCLTGKTVTSTEEFKRLAGIA